MKDKNGKLSCFVIMSELDKNEFIKLNDELFGEKGQLLDHVEKGTMIPFFGIGKESWDVDIDEWENHFYPCQMISGRDKYYWSIINKSL